jgi:hypothetical protein
LTRRVNEAVVKVQKDWNGNGKIKIPDNLEGQIRDIISEDSKLSWDEGIRMVEGTSETPAPLDFLE